jgi:TonB-dependent receptor
VITGYTSNTGNPALRPTISHSSDLAFQWFPKESTEAHLDFFYKTLNDTIIYANSLQPVPFVTTSGTTVTEYASATTDYNSPQSAIIKGAEIGGHTFFDRLPSPWNGLGMEANATYIDSHNPGNYYEDINGVAHYDTPIFGLSKYNYNAVLMYEKPHWSARLAWSWRSSYLVTTNNFRTTNTYPYYTAPGPASSATTIAYSLPIYAAQYGQLDFGLTYRPDSHVAIQLQFNNLTNETAKTLMGGYPNNTLYVRSWFTSDRRALLRISYQLF